MTNVKIPNGLLVPNKNKYACELLRIAQCSNVVTKDTKSGPIYYKESNNLNNKMVVVNKLPTPLMMLSGEELKARDDFIMSNVDRIIENESTTSLPEIIDLLASGAMMNNIKYDFNPIHPLFDNDNYTVKFSKRLLSNVDELTTTHKQKLSGRYSEAITMHITAGSKLVPLELNYQNIHHPMIFAIILKIISHCTDLLGYRVSLDYGYTLMDFKFIYDNSLALVNNVWENDEYISIEDPDIFIENLIIGEVMSDITTKAGISIKNYSNRSTMTDYTKEALTKAFCLDN